MGSLLPSIFQHRSSSLEELLEIVIALKFEDFQFTAEKVLSLD
jgi:hypothetical protein